MVGESEVEENDIVYEILAWCMRLLTDGVCHGTVFGFGACFGKSEGNGIMKTHLH